MLLVLPRPRSEFDIFTVHVPCNWRLKVSSYQVDRFKRREEEERGGGASRSLSYNKEPVSYNRGENYNSPGGPLRGGYQGGRSREGGGGSERRNLRLDDRTGRLAREHLHR